MTRMRKTIAGSFLGVLLGVIALLGVAYYWFTQQLEAVAPGSVENTRVVVPKGGSVNALADDLLEKGLIKDATVFRIYARQQNLHTVLQPGSYEISPGMTMEQIVGVLMTETEDVWVTIPEGLRMEEVAELFGKQDLSQFKTDEFLSAAAGSEGRLFPDTYLVPREITAEKVFDLLTNTFHQKVEVGLRDELAADGRDLTEILTTASLVQREGRSATDMRTIAGIIQNRLDIGMKLDIDATLSYLRGYDASAKSWWSAPNVSLKSNPSPYNTYLYASLPPTPIANPGLDAIQAVLDPISNDYLFYLHTPDGTAYYATTLTEHTNNINRYLR